MGKFRGKKLDLGGDVVAQIIAVSEGIPATVVRRPRMHEPFAFTTQQFNRHTADQYTHLGFTRPILADAKISSNQSDTTREGSTSSADFPTDGTSFSEAFTAMWNLCVCPLSECSKEQMADIAIIHLSDHRARQVLMYLGGRDWSYASEA